MNRYIDILDEYNFALKDAEKISRDDLIRAVTTCADINVVNRVADIISGEIINLSLGYVLFAHGKYCEPPHVKCNVHVLYTNTYHLYSSFTRVIYTLARFHMNLVDILYKKFTKIYAHVIANNYDSYQVTEVYQQMLIEKKCAEPLFDKIKYQTSSIHEPGVYINSFFKESESMQFILLIDFNGVFNLPREMVGLHKYFGLDKIRSLSQSKTYSKSIIYSKARGLSDEISLITCAPCKYSSELGVHSIPVSKPIHWILWDRVKPRKVLVDMSVEFNPEKTPYHVDEWDDTYRCAFTNAVIYDDCYVCDIIRKNSLTGVMQYEEPIHLLVSCVALNCNRARHNLLAHVKSGMWYDYILYRTKCPVSAQNICANVKKYARADYVSNPVYEEILQVLTEYEPMVRTQSVMSPGVRLFNERSTFSEIFNLKPTEISADDIYGLVEIRA